MKKLLPIFCVFLAWALCVTAAPAKLGSIASIEMALRADPSSRALHRGNLEYISQGVSKALAAAHYDEYTIPDRLSDRFRNAAEAMPRLMVEDIEKLSTQELVPSVIGLLEAGSREHKEELLRKVRHRLFVIEKAKELDVSPAELDGLLACKLVLVPFVSEFASFRTGKDKANCAWTMECRIGMLLYEIVGNETGRYAATLRVKAVAKGIGMASCSEQGRTRSGNSAEAIAFRRMVDNGVSNLIEASKQSADPYVLSPLRKWEDGDIWFEGGRDNGIRIGDKRLLIKQDQNVDGTVERKRKGWMVVTKPGKRGLAAESKASLVAGKAREGYFLGTFTRWPFDFSVGLRSFPIKGGGRSGLDSITLTPGAYGARAALLFNAGRYIGLNQLLFGAAYSAGLGKASGFQYGFSSGSNRSDQYMIQELEIPLVKRFFYRRLTAELGGSYCLTQVRVPIEGSNVVKTNSSKGFAIFGGPGIALTPSLTLLTRYAYQLQDDSQKWVYLEDGVVFEPNANPRSRLDVPVTYSGSSLQAEIVWNLPAFGK